MDRVSLHASIMAHERWSRCEDRTAATSAARAASPGSLTYWERKVDPDGILPPADRAFRAEHAKKAHFKRLAMKSAKVRRRKGGGDDDLAA